MRYKKQIGIIILVSILFLFSGLVFGFSGEIGLCTSDSVNLIYDVSCLTKFSALAEPFFLGSIAVLFISLILLFTRESTYLSWRRFAIWAIPISIIILWIAPTSTPGGWISGGDFTKETASWGVSVLLLLISLIIIIRKSLKSHS